MCTHYAPFSHWCLHIWEWKYVSFVILGNSWANSVHFYFSFHFILIALFANLTLCTCRMIIDILLCFGVVLFFKSIIVWLYLHIIYIHNYILMTVIYSFSKTFFLFACHLQHPQMHLRNTLFKLFSALEVGSENLNCA